VRYDPIHLWSTEEEQLTFFVSDSTVLVFGGSHKIADISNSDRSFNWSASLSHALGKNWLDSWLSLGLSTNQHEWFADTQVNLPF
jgi:hypothetical protein